MIWKPTYHSKIVQLIDFVAILSSFYIALLFWHIIDANFQKNFGSVYFTNETYLITILLSFVGIYIFKVSGAYSFQRFTSVSTEFKIILKVVIITVLLLATLLFITKQGNLSRTYLFIFFIVLLLLLVIIKATMYIAANVIRVKGGDRKQILIVGSGKRAEDFINIANANPNWGLDIIGILTTTKERIGTKLLGFNIDDETDNIESYLETHKVDDVIITVSTARFDKIRTVIDACEREGVQVRIISDFLGSVAKKLRADNVFGMPIISISMVHDYALQQLLKRVIDIVFGSILIVLTFPLMIIAVIGIMISDGRPVLYNWNVIGHNKKPFKSWKFRTMVKNADEIKELLSTKNEMSGPVFKIKDDPRIFKFGKWLRKWSIDELPQLFSVVKGDMSLVGPRPVFYHELVKYQSWQRRKLSVKPGLTCLWQINGRNKISDFNDWVKLDLDYIDNWSIWLDFKILFKTIPSVILGKGAS
ncbi:MAG TPA: sugar transferase [Ignavibacteria bacterium]|nr:sugar transferase [Ignavibacteria bacterium]